MMLGQWRIDSILVMQALKPQTSNGGGVDDDALPSLQEDNLDDNDDCDYVAITSPLKSPIRVKESGEPLTEVLLAMELCRVKREHSGQMLQMRRDRDVRRRMERDEARQWASSEVERRKKEVRQARLHLEALKEQRELRSEATVRQLRGGKSKLSSQFQSAKDRQRVVDRIVFVCGEALFLLLFFSRGRLETLDQVLAGGLA